MEWADEPPPPILLYQIGFGCIRGAELEGGGVGVGGGENKRSKTRRVEARRGEVLWIMLMIV